MNAPARLLDAGGRAIPAKAIAGIRARASLESPSWGGWSYDAQRPYSQEMAGWQPWLRSPDAEINLDRDRVVARARDLIRNDGWAQGSINRILDAAVGPSFSPIPRPNWRALSRFSPAFDAGWASEFASAVRADWQLYADDPGRWCDATRQQTVTQMFRLAFRHKLTDGDGLGAVLWDPQRQGAGPGRYATTLQVIDPDRLSNEYQRVDTHDLRGGVEVDDLGAARAYWLRRAHQNDWYDSALSMVWDRYPRETAWGRPIIIHDFDRERAEQHRGNGLLTAVLARFRMLGKFDQASLQAAVLRTLVGFFVKSPYDADQIQAAMDTDGGEADRQSWYQDLRGAYHDVNNLQLGGVRIPMMAPGESIEQVSAGDHATDFEAFQHAFLRSFAAATGQSAEEISNDFSKTNYSSYRGAMLQSWRTLIRRRVDFATGFCTPFYGCWLEEALDPVSGPLRSLLPANAPDFADLRGAYSAVQWIGPGRGWVDPVKERQGEVLGLDAGFGTLSDTTASITGRYWLDVLDERAVEEREMQKRGLTLPDWAGGQNAQATIEKPEAA